MSTININNKLPDLSALPAAKPGGDQASAPAGTDFGSVLHGLLSNTSQAQQDAAGLAKAFELGDGQIDLPQVMIAQQKARLSFQTVLQVRNKLTAAYQDIMNMPV